MYHSIAWRLQISYGLLLIAAFVGLGITSYHLERSSQLSSIDTGLQMRGTRVTGALYRMRLPLTVPKGAELDLPRHDALFTPPDEFPFYYRIWNNEQEILLRSNTGPDEIPFPQVGEKTPDDGLVRNRNDFRERIYRTPRGFIAMVGRNASTEFATIRSQTAKLAGAGLIILIAGLLLSHYLAKRTLKPIADISDAAKRIADGALDERIETQGNQSELGQLGEVLNNTFDELEGAYRRQEQFTADASHELRTPVTVILTEIQSAPPLSRSPDEYEECLKVCEESAISMQRLLQQLATLAQFDSGKVELNSQTLNLKELAEATIEQFRPVASDSGITVTSQLANESCQGDPDRLSQVLTNFLMNAVAYNQDGGTISVSVERENKDVLLKVSDTGIGIEDEDLPHLFERFYRADKSRFGSDENSGLGLAICKEIAEAHGGQITVESELEKGSTFILRIPC